MEADPAAPSSLQIDYGPPNIRRGPEPELASSQPPDPNKPRETENVCGFTLLTVEGEGLGCKTIANNLHRRMHMYTCAYVCAYSTGYVRCNTM